MLQRGTSATSSRWLCIGLAVVASWLVAADLSPATARLRPSSETRGVIRTHPQTGEMRLRGVPLLRLVAFAHRTVDSVVELDATLENRRYDGEARPAAGDADAWPTLARALAGQLGVRLQRESRQTPVLVLQQAGAEAWLQESQASETRIEHDRQRFSSQAGSMAALVDFAQRLTGRVIVDETGLPGRYDFVVEWDPSAGAYSFLQAFEDLGLQLVPGEREVEWIRVLPAEAASEARRP